MSAFLTIIALGAGYYLGWQFPQVGDFIARKVR
jgi:hypothetical protein